MGRDSSASGRFETSRMFRTGRATIAGVVLGLPVGVSVLLGGAYLTFAALPPVPRPIENPFSESKRVLGKILFWDEQLSSSNVVSCGTCHSPSRGGADDRIARNPGLDGIINTPDDILGSPGVIRSDVSNAYQRDPVFGLAPQITGRAANSFINSIYSPQVFWDGRAGGRFLDPQTGAVAIANGGALENQAVGPPTSSIEMAHANMNWDEITAKLRRVRPLELATNIPADVASVLSSSPSYPQLFAQAFGDGNITAARIAFAIATYERTLVPDQTPFDRFRAGDPNAMTPAQVQGFNNFQTVRCSSCHTTANDLFTDHSFRNIGLRPIAEDNGRQAVTNNPADRGRFRVPSLRNVGLKRTFMHNGMFQSLTDVIRFYARAPGSPPQFPDNLDPIMPTLNVPPQAAQVIEDFLRNGLTDPRVAAETFPFDRPTLFTNRPQDQAVILGGGVPGTGGIVPRIIAQAPPMIGNRDYRIGVDGTLGGAVATLGVSRNPPLNGRINPEQLLGSVMAAGAGVGTGIATLRWPLLPGMFSQGQVLFAQWFVQDPGAPGATAFSNIARITFFCGSYGCPSACPVADVNNDGGVTIDDLLEYLARYDGGDVRADIDDGSFTNTPDGGVSIEDLLFFLARFDIGC